LKKRILEKSEKVVNGQSVVCVVGKNFKLHDKGVLQAANGLAKKLSNHAKEREVKGKEQK
jgi:hypothetical protein